MFIQLAADRLFFLNEFLKFLLQGLCRQIGKIDRILPKLKKIRTS